MTDYNKPRPRGEMTRVHPNWLTCQINGVAGYICKCDGSPYVLRALADDLREAAQMVDAEIARRESAERGSANEGVFG